MLGAGVDLELAELLAAQTVARDHALDGLADDLLGPLLEQLAECPGANAARVSAVPPVALVLELLAGDHELLGVDDDDEVADVDVRRVGRLALAPQHVRNLGRQPAERL